MRTVKIETQIIRSAEKACKAFGKQFNETGPKSHYLDLTYAMQDLKILLNKRKAEKKKKL